MAVRGEGVGHAVGNMNQPHGARVQASEPGAIPESARLPPYLPAHLPRRRKGRSGEGGSAWTEHGCPQRSAGREEELSSRG